MRTRKPLFVRPALIVACLLVIACSSPVSAEVLRFRSKIGEAIEVWRITHDPAHVLSPAFLDAQAMNENIFKAWFVFTAGALLVLAAAGAASAEGEHGYGSLINGEEISYHHNLYAHHTTRVPRPAACLLDFRNNVIYDFGKGYNHGEETRMNYVGNYIKFKAHAAKPFSFQVGGWPEYQSAPPPVDTDHDGIPDEWEINSGLNPKDPSDANQDADGDGYTNIEEFFNGTDPQQKD